MQRQSRPFWEVTDLSRLSPDQWESLCDGCAKCCLQKLEDEETGEIHYTNVACHLLDRETCRCSDYPRRSHRVPTCVSLTPATLRDAYWLPATCAYRLVAEGRPLPAWHPLLTEQADSVIRAGQSACGRIISEAEAGDLEHHLVDWVE